MTQLSVVLLVVAISALTVQAQQVVGPVTFTEINTVTSSNTKAGSYSIPSGGVRVYRYIPSVTFDPVTHQLEARAVTSGNDALVVAEPCLIPGLPFRGAQGRNRNNERCDLVAGNVCTWQFAPCESVDAPYFITVENQDNTASNITIFVSEINLATVAESIVVGQWIHKNSTRGTSIVFGPVTVAAGETLEAFIIPDPAIRVDFDVTLLMDTKPFPSVAGACDALECGQGLKNFKAEDPCMMSAFSNADCLVNGMTSTAGQWYFRAEDNGKGTLVHSWRFRVRRLTPTSTSVAIDAAPAQQTPLAFADTAYFTFNTDGKLAGNFQVNVRAVIGTQTGLDAFNVILGNPGQTLSCSNRDTDSISMNNQDNEAQVSIDGCDSNGAIVPFSVTRIRAENESSSLRYTVEIVYSPGPTPVLATLDQNVSNTLDGQDRVYQLAFPPTTVAGAEFVPRVYNMVDIGTPANFGDMRMFVMRGTADPNCGNTLRYRCDTPVPTCARDDGNNGDSFMDLCQFASKTGDLFVYLEERNPTSYMFKPTVVSPVAVTAGETVSGSLASGEVKLYSLTNTAALRNFNAWGNSTANKAIRMETFSSGAPGCKTLEEGCELESVGCTTANFCPDKDEVVYVRLVNLGPDVADFNMMPSFSGTTPAITIGVPTVLTFTTGQGQSDQIVKFSTSTAQAFEVFANVQPARLVTLFVERTSCNFNNPAAQGTQGTLSYVMTDASEPAGEWYVRVRSGTVAGPSAGNVTITVRAAPCPTFSDLLGNTQNSFCNGSVALTKSVAPWDTFQNMDQAARDAYYLLQAAGTQTLGCESASKSLMCALNFPGCGPTGFVDNSADCLQDCQAHISNCYTSVCQDAVCGGLPTCTTSGAITGAITGVVTGPASESAASTTTVSALFALATLMFALAA